ncbi:MAG: shikimate kinase [Thermodesulfobacteriota bacterium]
MGEGLCPGLLVPAAAALFFDMKNIVLSGFMGTGKSTVAYRLARELGMTFVDLDSLIEDSAGKSIREIFSDLGEPAFRELESEAVRRVVSGALGDSIVLATGGGTVVDRANRALLKEWGFIICLRASVASILERTSRAVPGCTAESRPLLGAQDREAEIKRLLQERERAYNECELSIDTTDYGVAEVVGKIRAFIEGENA